MSIFKKEDTNSRNIQLDKEELDFLVEFSDFNTKSYFPFDFIIHNNLEMKKGYVKFQVTSRLNDKLNEIIKGSDEKLHSIFSTVLMLLINKYTRSNDIIISTPSYKKHNEDEYGNKTLVLRSQINDDDLIKELLHKVEQTINKAIEQPNYKMFSYLEQECSKRIQPFDVMIMLENIQESIFLEQAVYNTIFSFRKTEKHIEAIIHYNESLYKKETINKLSVHFLNILELVLNHIDMAVKDVNIFSNEKIQFTKLPYRKKIYPQNQTIHELFEQQVKRTPEKTALILEDCQICYAELNHRANQLARYLNECGVRKGDLIGISMERSADLYIGILAILKLGGAYVPLDSQYPKQRLSYVLEDSNISLLLTHGELSSVLPEVPVTVICVDKDRQQIDSMSGSNLNRSGSGDDLAYVMYTSGSTGKPKGVSIIHRGVVRLVKGNDFAELDESKTFLQLAPVAFDASTFEIWGSLLNGGCLAVMSAETPTVEEIAKAIKKHQVTTLWLTAGLFSLVVDQQLEALTELHQLLVGGDVVSVPHVRKVLELGNVQVINGYGPTEGTTFTCCFSVPQGWNGDTLPIGRPIANTEVFILDSHLNPVPPGVPGEMYIGGDGLAREYWRLPDLTRERFIPHPFNKTPKARLYKTGDLVRYLSDGNIEFIGRLDHQVKIRGFRIELGEIENKLQKYKKIKETVVTTRNDKNGNKYICAYYTSEKGIPNNKLREFLRSSLPEYMIPTYFLNLDKFPLTENGKIDKRALPTPDISHNTNLQYEAPKNDTEKKLVAIWENVLERERIGINDDFFDLGGHSLKASMVISRIRKRFGVEVRIKEVFENSTIKQLSELIQKKDKKHYTIINKAENKKYYKASSAEKRMFALWETDKNSIVYNLPIMIELTEELDICKVEEVLNEIVRRHEALRTSFHVVDGELVQRVHDKWNLEFNHKKLQKKEALLYMKKFIKPFDLTLAPLIRCSLITYENKNIILLDVHHIAADGVSVGLIRKEFKKLYKGEKLEKAVLQYKDYSEWQIDSLNQETSIKQEQYWLNRLSGELPILNIQTDYERPRVKSFEGSRINFTLDKMLTTKLRTIAKETGTTLYMVLLAVYNVMLAKYSNQEDIIVGTAESGRSYADLENTVGMFVNTVALRNFPESHKTFREFLEEVKYNTLKDFDNTDYQFENLTQKLALKRDASRNPLFDVMFTFESMDYGFSGDEEIDELKLLESEINISKFDLTLT
ncbi:amino acid adenylation domain-containing protein, partial [Bacillus cereus]|nr:amino acid adenylation domain-containing protein [Bacillus cereus]MCU4858013.1 amino acid adenylation domain-containing protein [Bacillus cereus]MCU4943097.1 amino acid adenylation domain-containing protein [Bacillus cereus]